MSEKWTLDIGCHRGTLATRDSERRQFDTREKCLTSYRGSKKFWRSIGYMVWFADITSPDGTKEHLESNPYY